MRDSGVEWLGEVPENWEIMQFRRICSLNQGLQKAQSERFFEPGENRFEYITIKSINNPNSPKEYIENPPKSVICNRDDVLLARTGATGEVITNQNGVFHNNFFSVNYDNKRVYKEFLVCYLQNSAIKNHLLMLAGTTTIPDLNHSEFLSTQFLLPPFEEQVKIVAFIESQSNKIDRAVSRIEKEIALLQEYRTALISEVVTGKIDVREAI
jgi:type I restriction enzyme S subunit